MRNNKKSSIVIRTHNHASNLEILLKKIKSQKKIEKPEIIVIDSNSTDETDEICKSYGCRIIKINPKDFSHAYTFNLGAKNSKNELIVYASVDIIPKNNFWLFHLLKHFKNKKVAGVFSRQEPILNFNPIEEFKTKLMFPEKGNPVTPFSNASGVLRKSVWTKIKYNEKLPFQHIGGEDQTLVVQAKKMGYKIIYEPKSVVYHSHKYPLKTRLKLAYLIELNREKVDKWNKDVAMLSYKKIDLMWYLIKKGAIKSLFIDLIIGGILMRLWALKGKLDKKRLIFAYFPFKKI